MGHCAGSSSRACHENGQVDSDERIVLESCTTAVVSDV